MFGNSKMSLSVSVASPPKMVRPMSRKDIFYSGSVTNLREFQSQKTLEGYRNSVVSLTRFEKEMRAQQGAADPRRRSRQYESSQISSQPDPERGGASGECAQCGMRT